MTVRLTLRVGELRIGAALCLLGALQAEADAVILAVCPGSVAVNAVLHATERRPSRWRQKAARWACEGGPPGG